MGLATFLLHMIQLQASAKKYKIDLYLQSNIASPAFEWYKHHGFNLAPTNAPEELPDVLNNWYISSQSMMSSLPYIHFVTTEKWNKEVEKGGNKPLSEEWQSQRLLLIHLDKNINLRGTVVDVDIPTVKPDELTVIYKVYPQRKLILF